jgi:pilus assembly protein CpaB
MKERDATERAGVALLKDRIESTDTKGLVILIVSVVLAGLCAGGLYLYMKNATPIASVEPPKVVPVVVATKDLTFGTVLQREHLKQVDFPPESVPRGYYSDLDSVVNQSTRVFLIEGEPVLGSKLSSIGGGLSLRIPEDKRAISLSVNEITGVNGFVLPGDRVDVLVTVDNAKGSNVAVTETILQNIEVLASGSKTETKRNHQITVQTVTLIVDTEGAEALALGMHQGEVNLVLRNPVDTKIVATKLTDTKSVLDLYTTRTSSYKRPSTTKKAPDPEPSYTIIRNGNITHQSSPEKNK